MLRLIEDIVNGQKKLTELDNTVLLQLIDASVVNEDFRALENLTNHYTGIYDYNDKQPYWLKSDFEAPIWVVNFGGKDKFIKWNSIILDDDLNLTSPKHQNLLNAFKYWIAAIDSPQENGGKLIKTSTAQRKCSDVIVLINAILLHSKELNLSQYHLRNVNEDFWLNILVSIVNGNGVADGVYEVTKRTSSLIETIIKDIQQSEVDAFIDKFPYLKKTLTSEEKLLDLTQSDRQKACFWLYHNRRDFYYDGSAFIPKGRNSTLASLLFGDKALIANIHLKKFPELELREPVRITEFKAVENCNRHEGISENVIKDNISSINLIYTNLNREDASQPTIFSSPLTVQRIKELVILKRIGRTRTLPPQFIFNLIRQCYDFTKEKQDLILNSTLVALKEGITKSTNTGTNPIRPNHSSKNFVPEIHGDMPHTERGYWFENEAIQCVDSSLLNKGVKQVAIFRNRSPHRFQRIRNNESLFELFNVLQGAVQTLTGAVMARRQDEMVLLKSHGNLVPNVNPHLKENEDTEFSLMFRVKKSGVGGKNSINATICRPIPTSIARFIWNLEQFNLKAKRAGLNKGELSLFNNLNSSHCALSKITGVGFNRHLDAACDYFETDLVKYDNGEYRRIYIRQHQLRRFFVMCFFWSKGFDGIDSLQWMLGHTDMEHLYNYISEGESGAILNGAKASIILRGITDKESELAKIENIDKVESAIAKRLGLREHGSITLSTVSESVEDYDDESYLTVPHINQLKAEQAIENEIIYLLESENITLEPEFFTIENEDGEKTRTFTLKLKVKNLD